MTSVKLGDGQEGYIMKTAERVPRAAKIFHAITPETEAKLRVMVMLGEADAPVTHRQLLINLTDRLPADVNAYERIAEIVDVDPERKRLSRERYKQYRDRGCALESHNL